MAHSSQGTYNKLSKMLLLTTLHLDNKGVEKPPLQLGGGVRLQEHRPMDVPNGDDIVPCNSDLLPLLACFLGGGKLQPRHAQHGGALGVGHLSVPPHKGCVVHANGDASALKEDKHLGKPKAAILIPACLL